MAISTNSYGSVAAVQAFTRRFLDGENAFNSTTRPTLSEVEGMIDRASAALNVALAGEGLAVPIAEASAKLACDEWAVAHVVDMVEMTRAAQGWSGEPADRAAGLRLLMESAGAFARRSAPSFKWLGCAVKNAASEGLAFTGGRDASERDASAEAPRFERGMFAEDGAR